MSGRRERERECTGKNGAVYTDEIAVYQFWYRALPFDCTVNWPDGATAVYHAEAQEGDYLAVLLRYTTTSADGVVSEHACTTSPSPDDPYWAYQRLTDFVVTETHWTSDDTSRRIRESGG